MCDRRIREGKVADDLKIIEQTPRRSSLFQSYIILTPLKGFNLAEADLEFRSNFQQ